MKIIARSLVIAIYQKTRGLWCKPGGLRCSCAPPCSSLQHQLQIFNATSYLWILNVMCFNAFCFRVSTTCPTHCHPGSCWHPSELDVQFVDFIVYIHLHPSLSGQTHSLMDRLQLSPQLVKKVLLRENFSWSLMWRLSVHVVFAATGLYEDKTRWFWRQIYNQFRSVQQCAIRNGTYLLSAATKLHIWIGLNTCIASLNLNDFRRNTTVALHGVCEFVTECCVSPNHTFVWLNTKHGFHSMSKWIQHIFFVTVL